jgi:hypothetical protein
MGQLHGPDPARSVGSVGFDVEGLVGREGVAKNLGHVDTRMVEPHYGHLSGSFVRDAVALADEVIE